MEAWESFAYGLGMILASALVADWRCRRWRKQAARAEAVALELNSRVVRYDDTLRSWKETTEIWKKTAAEWREIAEKRKP